LQKDGFAAISLVSLCLGGSAGIKIKRQLLIF
jgi:hypothetical protein